MAPDVNDLLGSLNEQTNRLIRGSVEPLVSQQRELDRLFDFRLIRDIVGNIEDRAQDVDAWAGELAAGAVEVTRLGDEESLGPEVYRMSRTLQRGLEHYA